MFANDGHEPEWIDGKLHIGETEVNDLEEYTATTGTNNKEASTKSKASDEKDAEVSKKIGNFLSFGGDMIKKGLNFVGKSIGEGIRSSK